VEKLEIREGGEREGITFSLSGICDNADGSLADRIFWIIVDEAATPHTVPILRKR